MLVPRILCQVLNLMIPDPCCTRSIGRDPKRFKKSEGGEK